MNRLLKWLTMGLLSALLLVVVLFGPGRIYGLFRARQLDGQIVKIKPLELDKTGNVGSYLVKLYDKTGQIHVFASSDEKWMMFGIYDLVRVTLYPSPPWSRHSGQWQNARLIAKLIPPSHKHMPEKIGAAGLSNKGGTK